MTDTKPKEGAATYLLLVAGALLYEWGIPIQRAAKGLKIAYEMEKEKQEKRSRVGGVLKP